MCIDHNECRYDNPCDPETEVCLNSYGNYFCFCKFGYEWSSSTNKCILSEILTRALKRYGGLNLDSSCAACNWTEFKTSFLLAIFYSIIIKLK